MITADTLACIRKQALKGESLWPAHTNLLLDEIELLTKDRDRYCKAYWESAHEIDQTLGRALGYPVYPDNDPNCPGEPGEVETGEHVPETLAMEAANKIRSFEQTIASYREALESFQHICHHHPHLPCPGCQAQKALADLSV